MLISPLKIT